MTPFIYKPTIFCIGISIASSMFLSDCDNKLEDMQNEINKAHQQKMKNCEDHSDPQACKDLAISETNEALTALQDAWAETVLENWSTEKEFKRELIRKIMDLPEEAIKNLLLKIVSDGTSLPEMEASLLGDVQIQDLAVITDAATLYDMASKSNVIIGPDPIQLVSKSMSVDVSTNFEYLGTNVDGQMTGTITVLVGETQTGPRQIQVISGSLTISSDYTDISQSPIVYLVRKNGDSRMIVGANGQTILRLDLDGSKHPFSYAHDENPIFEIPMIESSHNNFDVSVAAPFGYLHAWRPYPISDFNEDGIYDNSDVSAFSQDLANNRIITDLNMDSVYDLQDFDLFMSYFLEDQSRWMYQSERFVND